MPVVGKLFGPEWQAVFIPQIQKYWVEQLAKNPIKLPASRERADDGVSGD